MTRILLDTNAYSGFKRGVEATRRAIAGADEILVPVPVLAELRVGFRAGNKERTNISELEDFLLSNRVTVPAMDEQTAVFYAEIFSALKKNGTPIPIRDVWIAACALANGAMLLSDDAHFDAITGLVKYKD